MLWKSQLHFFPFYKQTTCSEFTFLSRKLWVAQRCYQQPYPLQLAVVEKHYLKPAGRTLLQYRKIFHVCLLVCLWNFHCTEPLTSKRGRQALCYALPEGYILQPTWSYMESIFYKELFSKENSLHRNNLYTLSQPF